MSASKQVKQKHIELWKEWKDNQSLPAKKILIEQYLPLVEYVVNRLAIGLPKNVGKDELCSHGVIGLIDAVEKFDPYRNLQFETYASWRIRGAIIDGIRQNDWVPRSVREKAKKIEEAYQILEQKYMRSVGDKEMSEYFGITEEEFRKMLQDVTIATFCSLEAPLKDEDNETRMSLLEDQSVMNPDRVVHQQFLQEALAKAIDKLTERERTVISLYYYEDLSLSEIAEVMSLTPSRISQLHSSAMLRLRGALERNRQLLVQDT